MKPSTFLVVFGSALTVLQVEARVTETTATDNSDVSVTEDWSDITSHAMKVISEGLKFIKSQTDSQVRNDTEVLVGSMNQTLSKLAMETEAAEKDIARFDNKMRDTDQTMAGIRTELNAFAQNVYQYHTEVIGIRQGLENKMERLESKMDKGFLDIAKKFTDVNSKVDNGFAENAKEFQVVGVLFADVNKRLDATNKRLDDLIKLIQPLIPSTTTVKPRTNNLIRVD